MVQSLHFVQYRYPPFARTHRYYRYSTRQQFKHENDNDNDTIDLQLNTFEMENYIVLEHIGEGSFGKVYKARRKNTGFTVAMKFISKHGKSEKDVRNLRQEIGILRKLNHENIILMFDAFETDRDFCVVTEYAPGELFDILQVH